MKKLSITKLTKEETKALQIIKKALRYKNECRNGRKSHSNLRNGDNSTNQNQQKRVIIAGGRDFKDYSTLKSRCEEILEGQKQVTILSGGQRGATH